MPDKEFKIDLIAENRQAIRSVRELQRQVDKLGDLANQGKHRQEGFLSSKQVSMFRDIVKEMESTYSNYYDNLERMERSYQEQVKRTQEKIQKNQENLNRAEGGNKWGDVSSPAIQQFYRNKIHEGESELKGLGELEKQIAALSDTVGKMEGTVNSSRGSVNSINNMHQMDPETKRYIQGMVDSTANSAMAFGGLKTVSYTFGGMDLIRQGNLAGVPTAMRTDYAGDDEQVRTDARDLGLQNQYTAVETMQTQGILLSGGNQSKETIQEDTGGIQQFSRAYALDANQVASTGTMLQRMGTLEEGQMTRFANLIGGAVNRGGMRGREEELLRSTSTLMASISNQLTNVSEDRFANVLGLQSTLGEAVPELSGERGAQRIQSMHEGIQSGDGSFDVIMGKGTKYVGIEGMYELAKRKEEGASNPQNLVDYFEGAYTHFGGNEMLVAQAARKDLGISLHDFEAMRDSGFIDQIRQGNLPTADELNEIGAVDTAKYAEMWDGSESRDYLQVEAEDENIQSKWSWAGEETGTGMRQLWHGLPDWAQLVGIGGATIGGGALLQGMKGKGLFKGMKKFMPTIGDTSKGVKPVQAMLGKGSDMVGKLGKGISSFGGTASKGVGEIMKIGGKALPLAGLGLSTGIDRVENPEHSWGRSLAKGVGSTIGGLVAGGATIASGAVTGGAGWLATGAASTAGAYAGEKVGDGIYSFFAGDEDKEIQKQKNIEKEVKESIESSYDRNAEPIEKVKSVSVNNSDELAKSIARENEFSESGQQQVDVNINVSGKIDGMNEKNQDEITRSVTGNLFGAPILPGFNLAADLLRGGR